MRNRRNPVAVGNRRNRAQTHRDRRRDVVPEIQEVTPDAERRHNTDTAVRLLMRRFQFDGHEAIAIMFSADHRAFIGNIRINDMSHEEIEAASEIFDRPDGWWNNRDDRARQIARTFGR